MAYSGGIITAPVEIVDVQRAIGLASNDLWTLGHRDVSGENAYIDTGVNDGSITFGCEPFWNPFSESSPAEWFLDKQYGSDRTSWFYSFRFKPASYWPSTLPKGAVALEHFSGYNHYSMRTRLSGFPSEVNISTTYYTVNAILSVSKWLDYKMWQEFVEAGYCETHQMVYGISIGNYIHDGGTIVGAYSNPMFNGRGWTLDSTNKGYSRQVTVNFTGINMYEGQHTYKYVYMAVYKFTGDLDNPDSVQNAANYTMICNVGYNYNYFNPTVHFVGTVIQDYMMEVTNIKVQGDRQYQVIGAYLTWQGINANYAAFDIGTLAIGIDTIKPDFAGDSIEIRLVLYYDSGDYSLQLLDLLPITEDMINSDDEYSIYGGPYTKSNVYFSREQIEQAIADGGRLELQIGNNSDGNWPPEVVE